MKPWMLPLISIVGAVIIMAPSLFLLQIFQSQQKAESDYYLSIRIEDVAAFHVPEHVLKVEKDYGFHCNWIAPMILKAHADYPHGTLFFFNTSEEQWDALGGEIGYAIMLNGRIVWKKRIARS